MLGRKPVSARLSCFIDFIGTVGCMTVILFSQIGQDDGYLCRVSLSASAGRRMASVFMGKAESIECIANPNLITACQGWTQHTAPQACETLPRSLGDYQIPHWD